MATPLPGHIAQHAALLAPGALPLEQQRAIAAQLARSHGNAHVQRAIGARSLARLKATPPPERVAFLTAYAERIVAHRANVAAIANEVSTWRSDPHPVRRNTARWLFPTAGRRNRLRLHVLTKTHDAAARAKRHRRDGIAYFGFDTAFPSDAASYDLEPESRRGLLFADDRVAATQEGRRVMVMEPASRSPQNVLGKLVHEVQHFADRHVDDPDWDKPDGSPEQSWARYKTEFRAFWVQGEIQGDPNPWSGAAPFNNERQKRIFKVFYDGYYATWLKPNYDDNTDVRGRKFQDLVHSYAWPEGVNLLNSPRIDDLYVTVGRCKPKDVDPSKPPLSDLLSAAQALDDADRTHVNSSKAKALQERLKDRLARSAFDAVALTLGQPGWAAVNISPARRAILSAARGQGVDRDAVYAAIAGASPAERAEMGKDSVIMGTLRKELRGKDLWRARMYLEYGPRAKWPKAVLDQDR